MMAEMTVCRRWSVVFEHDGSPIDGCLFVHKAAAEKARLALPNKEKTRIEHVCILSDAVVAELLKQDGAS